MEDTKLSGESGDGARAANAKAVPLVELLRGVPPDARLLVEHDWKSSTSHPVGRYAHEAAEEIERLTRLSAVNLPAGWLAEEGRAALDAFRRRVAIADGGSKGAPGDGRTAVPRPVYLHELPAILAAAAKPHGCVCPIGAEATCAGFSCPRRGFPRQG